MILKNYSNNPYEIAKKKQNDNFNEFKLNYNEIDDNNPLNISQNSIISFESENNSNSNNFETLLPIQLSKRSIKKITDDIEEMKINGLLKCCKRLKYYLNFDIEIRDKTLN